MNVTLRGHGRCMAGLQHDLMARLCAVEEENMHPVLRLFGIVVVFCVAAIAWIWLGATTRSRTNEQSTTLRGAVTELWGNEQAQKAPVFRFEFVTVHEDVKIETVDGTSKEVRRRVEKNEFQDMSPRSTDLAVHLKQDERRKGLLWYALYDVNFQGSWSYKHEQERAGTMRLLFHFPDAGGLYDDFRFVVNGVDLARRLRPDASGVVSSTLAIRPGDELTLVVGYRSRGLDRWRYLPANGTANLENFRLQMHTDFAEIDFPAGTMSPSKKARDGEGWRLDWDFGQVITGRAMGMVLPQRVQPGEMASTLSYSAPVSLLFFFTVIFVLATLRGIDIHPINYLMLAGAFFAFHLLFGYLADHLSVVDTFIICSAVSMVLVISYLRLVVSPRFAFLEAAGAQLAYLVGFSLAHFWSGFTGLTITIMAIFTLFLMMQLTGRIRWSRALADGNGGNERAAAVPA